MRCGPEQESCADQHARQQAARLTAAPKRSTIQAESYHGCTTSNSLNPGTVLSVSQCRRCAPGLRSQRSESLGRMLEIWAASARPMMPSAWANLKLHAISKVRSVIAKSASISADARIYFVLIAHSPRCCTTPAPGHAARQRRCMHNPRRRLTAGWQGMSPHLNETLSALDVARAAVYTARQGLPALELRNTHRFGKKR